MPEIAAAPPPERTRFLATERRDAWWAGPLATGAVLVAFGVYATFRVFHNAHFEWQSLLSPFYSPLIVWPEMPRWLSPAMLILWAPFGFRATCYYYRKAYYRAWFAHPVACAVGEGRRGYCGETKFPLIAMNVHRYFLYVALVFNVILWIDAIKAFFWSDGFHLSLGTLVLTANAFLLMCYSLSCHSLRHIVGGNIDCYSCTAFGNLRHKLWKGASRMNEHHMLWAWTSLFGVGFADFYVWMVASGAWKDLRIF